MWNLLIFFGFVSSSEFDFVQIVYEEIKVELIPANAIPSKMSGDASYLLWPWFSFEVLLKLDVRGGGSLQESRKSLAPLSHSQSWPVTRLCSQGPDAAALSRAILATFHNKTSQMSRTQGSVDSRPSMSVCDKFVSQLQSSFTILYSHSHHRTLSNHF